jgi:hypothetical protein
MFAMDDIARVIADECKIRSFSDLRVLRRNLTRSANLAGLVFAADRGLDVRNASHHKMVAPPAAFLTFKTREQKPLEM